MLVLARHFVTPFFYCHADCATYISGINTPGYGWRLTQDLLFNKIAFRLFGPWWTGYALICQAVTLTMGFSAYLFWVIYARVTNPAPGAYALGRRAGLLAGAALVLTDYMGILDIVGMAYRLAAATALLVLVFTVQFLRRGHLAWWFGALAAYLMACASHSFAWLLPVLLFFLEASAWARGQLRQRLPGAVVRLMVMFGTLGAFLLVMVGTEELGNRIQGALGSGGQDGDQGPTLLISSYIYKVAINPGLESLGWPDPTAGTMAYLAEAAFLTVCLAGLVRLCRGRPDGLSPLFLLLFLWFALTVPQQLGAGDTWLTTTHRFVYLRVGLALMVGWLVALALGMVARLLPGRLARGAPTFGALLLVGAGTIPVGFWEGVQNLTDARTWEQQAPCAIARKCPGHGSSTASTTPGPCADLSYQNLSLVIKGGEDLSRANLTGLRLPEGRLAGANLEGACAYWSDFGSANLEGSHLAGAELVGSFLDKVNLQDADLRGCDLRSSNIRHAFLKGANLAGANLANAVLEGTDLRGANLSRATLLNVDLRDVDLRGADLRGADLRYSNSRGARLEGALLDKARLCQMTLRLELTTGTPEVLPCPGHPPANIFWPPPRQASQGK